MKDSDTSFLSKARSIFWPIYGKENSLFLPMAFMLSLILFVYTMCRGIKDAGVVNAADGSAIITFLKVYGVVPFAILFFIIFSWLNNKFSRRSVFYIVTIPFLVYFLAYAFLIYPYADSLHPNTMVDSMIDWFDEGPVKNWFTVFISMLRYWTHASFYIMSELWGSAVLSLMFWQFANDIIPVTNAKRFYAHFYLVGNCFVMLAGLLTEQINVAFRSNYTVGLQLMIGIVFVAGAIAVALYYYINNVVLKDPDFQLVEGAKPAKKAKAKMSIGEGIKFLFRSPYLGLIALLVICYGVAINLCEVLWKEMIYKMYQAQLALDPLFANLPEKEFKDAVKAAYNGYMGKYFLWTGFFTIIAILIGSTVLRKFGWKITALATPILLGLSSAAFFIFVIWRDEVGMALGMTGVAVLTTAVFAGLIQNLLSKPTKYAMFDPTKEMAYIPLDPESKAKGKAAVDVVGARLGKSGGAVIGQVLTAVIGPSAIAYAPASFALTIVFVLIWVGAASGLSTRFKALTGEK